MSEKAPAKTKSRPPGIFSTLIFAVFKTLVISVMAWLVLIIWFLVEVIALDQNRVLQQAQSIVFSTINFISLNERLKPSPLRRTDFIISIGK